MEWINDVVVICYYYRKGSVIEEGREKDENVKLL